MKQSLLPIGRLASSLIQTNRLFLLLFGMVAFVAHAQVPDYVPTEGLVDWWPLDGNATNFAGDNDGAIEGCLPAENRFGEASKALFFDGQDDRVSLDTFFGGQQMPAVSYSLWFNSVGSSDEQFLSGKEGFWRTIYIRLTSANDIRFGGTSQGVYFGVTSDEQAFELDTWHHLVVTFEDAIITLFLDGNQIAQGASTANLLDYQFYAAGNSTATNYFGAIHPVSSGLVHFFNGKMDDFGLWDRALTEEEITALYNIQLPVNGCTDPTACNYDAEATSDDGSCTHPPFGLADCETAGSAQSEWELIVPQESLPDSYRSDEFLFDSTTRQWYVHYQENGLLASIDVDAGTVTEIGATNWFGRSDEMVLDPIGQKLYGWRAGTSSLYEISTSGGSWSQVFSAGNDGHHYGASAYWNGETSRPGFVGGYGYWTMHNQIFEVNSAYSGWAQKRGDTNTGNPPRMNGPIAGNGEGNALLWYGHHGNINGNQYTCNLSISDGGNYCWSRGLWHIDLASHTASTIISLDDPEIDQYGDIAWDYLRNEVYVVGGKLVSSDATNTTNEDDYEWTSRVIRFNLDTSDGFTVLESEGLPVLETYGQVIYDETEDRLLMLRSDGLWALPLSQESSQESNPTSIPDDFCSTTYYPNSNESHKTCRFQLAMDSLHAINGSQAAPSLMDFLKGQTIGSKVYLEWDMQAIMDSINAVIAELPNVDSGSASDHTCGDPVSYHDYDYATVEIGDQCWFAENLRSAQFTDGSAIPTSAVDPFGDNAANIDTWGLMYEGTAVIDSRGLCPSDWHISSNADWQELINYAANNGYSGNESSALKSASGWSSGANGSDAFGFNAKPGGFHYNPIHPYWGEFNHSMDSGYWWTSTTQSASASSAWTLQNDYLNPSYDHSNGMSVRCLKD